MKKIYTKLNKCLYVLLLVFITNMASAQTITAVSHSANPSDCTPITFTADVTLWFINTPMTGISTSVNGSTIYVDINFNTPPIGLPAIGFQTYNTTANNIPPGTYTVTFRSYDNGVFQNSMNTAPMVVTSCCGVSSNISTFNDFICTGQSATLTGSTNATSFAWSTNGIVLDTTNLTLTSNFPYAGTYTYVLEAFGGPCNAIDSVTVTVDSVSFELGNDTTLCSGQNVVLSSAIPGNSNHIWSNSSTSAAISVTTAGTYIANVTLNACAYSDTIMVSYNPDPIVTVGADTTVCNGDSAMLTASANVSNFSWNTGSTDSIITVNASGTYTVTASDSIGCSSFDAAVVTILAPINIGLNALDSLTGGDSLVADAGIFASYSWSTGDTTQTLTILNEGTYSVTVTDANGCIGTDSMVVAFYTGTNRLNIPTINIYPNPTNGILNIQTPSINKFEKALIINSLGQIVQSNYITNTQLDVQALNSGVYFVQFVDDKNQIVGRARFVRE